MSSGSKANRTGNRLEQFVRDTLIGNGYKQVDDHKKQLSIANRCAIGGKHFQEQVYVGDSIYKSKRNVDFMVFNPSKFKDGLIIECKWQQSSGSVDEKYPFLICNIIKTAVPTIILLDGGGYKQAAKDWLKAQVKKPNSSLIGVYSMSEFLKKVNNAFLG